MSYCKKDDNTATITWKWNAEIPKKFTSNVVPVEVVIEENLFGTWAMITFDNITASSPFSYIGTSLESPVATNRQIKTAKTNRQLYADTSFSAGAIQLRDVLFIPNSLIVYKIKILDTTGKLLFEDFKATTVPPTYTVACGNGCPEGYCKCIISEYPGYCCLDCASAAASIRAITNELRGKNG